MHASMRVYVFNTSIQRERGENGDGGWEGVLRERERWGGGEGGGGGERERERERERPNGRGTEKD